jgi:hypothetical protein
MTLSGPVLVLSVVSGIVAAVAGLTFTWGIPVATFWWYIRSRSGGKLLLATGFTLGLLADIVEFLVDVLVLPVYGPLGRYETGISLLLWLLATLALPVAVLGFATMVRHERN